MSDQNDRVRAIAQLEEAGTIRIFQQLQRAKLSIEADAKRAFVLQSTKTKAGERTLKIDPDLVAVLRRHRTQQAEKRLLLGEKWSDRWDNLVFTSETGAPIHLSCLLDHLHGVLAKHELPRIRFHDQRHTAATLMLADNVPLVTVSKILRHSSPAITATIYAHALDESNRPLLQAYHSVFNRQDQQRSALLSPLLNRPRNSKRRLRQESAVYRVPMLVPEAGLEPARGYPQGFLRPQRLPFRHSGLQRIIASFTAWLHKRPPLRALGEVVSWWL